MNLERGLLVTDSIELRSLIGRGGMGQVWSAFHLTLCREVAVKFLSGPLAESAVALERFSLEAQTIGRLQCPYVPQVFDFGRMPDGAPFLVMELLEGLDLQSILEKEGALSLSQTERLVGQMCAVLSLAHGLGLVHRDIKPDNIVVVPGMVDTFIAKLLDFGIVKALDATKNDLTRTGSTIGTPSYMSPEQLMGEKAIDGSADLWSLAVVAYCCLTGAFPFAGETFGAVCLSIHNDAVVAPSVHRVGLPEPLDAWFRKALHRLLEERFASASEMAVAFSKAALRDSAAPPLAATSLMPPGDPTTLAAAIPLTRSKRPNPRRAGSLKTLAILIAVSVVLLGTVSALDPDLAPAWLFAGHLERTWAGAVGRRATSFANSGPLPTPVMLSAPDVLPWIDASAPTPVAVPVAPTAAASVAIRTPPRGAISPRPQPPVTHAAESAWTAIPKSPVAPEGDPPSGAEDDPYAP
jgi:serine/threonine-protein kinase